MYGQGTGELGAAGCVLNGAEHHHEVEANGCS
jgi:hypothetical protein